MLTSKFKQMYLGSVKAAKAVIYTVPTANNQSIIKDLMISNNDATKTVTVKMYINDAVFVNQSIAAGDTLFPDREWTMVLNPGDKIQIETTEDDVVQVILSGAETVTTAD